MKINYVDGSSNLLSVSSSVWFSVSCSKKTPLRRSMAITVKYRVYLPTFELCRSHFRGLVAVILTFVLFGVTHTPDGPFRRPHPAFWRLILCLSIVYELALVFLLFQVSCPFFCFCFFLNEPCLSFTFRGGEGKREMISVFP